MAQVEKQAVHWYMPDKISHVTTLHVKSMALFGCWIWSTKRQGDLSKVVVSDSQVESAWHVAKKGRLFETQRNNRPGLSNVKVE